MRKKYLELSEFFATGLALFAGRFASRFTRRSACFLGAVLLATTLGSCGGVRENQAGEEALTTSFGVRDFRKIVDDMVEAMVTNRGLKEDLGDLRPTLLISPVVNRSDEHIDTQLINDSIRVRLNRARLFTFVNRNHLETLLEEQQLGESGLADPDSASQIGRLVGAQYLLHGSIANIRTRESGDQQIFYKVVLTLTELETGIDYWVDEAEVSKTSSRGLF